MINNVKESIVKLKERSIEYISFGNGKKTLIMIQGLNTRGIKGAGIMLSFMYRMFTKDYTVYVFERRLDATDGITVRDMAMDVAAAMDQLGILKADVFGVSQGGMIAQYLAMDRPDLVNKLVLAVTLSKKNDIVEAVISNWICLATLGKTKELVLDMAMKMYSKEYVKRYRLCMPLLTWFQRPKNVKRFIVLAKACLTCNTYDELDKIKCPVFVIGGKQDQIVGKNASQEMAEKLNCELYLYENLGHGAYEEANDFKAKCQELSEPLGL